MNQLAQPPTAPQHPNYLTRRREDAKDLEIGAQIVGNALNFPLHSFVTSWLRASQILQATTTQPTIKNLAQRHKATKNAAEAAF